MAGRPQGCGGEGGAEHQRNGQCRRLHAGQPLIGNALCPCEHQLRSLRASAPTGHLRLPVLPHPPPFTGRFTTDRSVGEMYERRPKDQPNRRNDCGRRACPYRDTRSQHSLPEIAKREAAHYFSPTARQLQFRVERRFRRIYSCSITP